MLLAACGVAPAPGEGAGGSGSGGGGFASGGGAGGGDAAGGPGGGGTGGSAAGGGEGGGAGGGLGPGGGAGGGAPAGRPDAPAMPCVDAPAALYAVALASLGPFTSGARGEVVACAPDESLSLQELQARLGTVAAPLNPVEVYRVVFRTGRGNGQGGLSSARVWLPQGTGGPADVVVAAHGSEGLADACAPTRKQGGAQDLALPFAARGKVVIAPDYAGLGVEGVQGYLDNRDTAYSVLDAARAARALLPAGATTDVTGALGHSQGGGAVLAAQALAKTYGPPLEAVAAFAPQYPTRLNSFGFLSALRNPLALTITLGVSKPAIYVMRHYAWQVNYRGPQTAGDGFPAAKRSGLVGAVESQCLIALGGAVQATSPKVGDLFDDALRTSLLACADGAAGCAGAGKDTFDFLMGNLLPNDPQGARVLLVQGSLDTILPPAEEAACTVNKLVAEGVPHQACVDSGAGHASVVDRNMAHAAAWLEASLRGATPPACPGTATLPTCTP